VEVGSILFEGKTSCALAELLLQHREKEKRKFLKKETK